MAPPQAPAGFGDDPRRRISQRPFTERRRGSVLVGQRSIDILAASRPEQPDAGPRFVKFIIRQYRRYGYFISDHDWKAMLICLIISGLGLLAVFITPQQNDITGYSPYGARARVEYARYQDFFAHNGLGITVYLYALAKDDGSMLRDDYLKESLHVLDDIMENVTFHDAGRNKSMNFQEFCMSFCSINEPVRQFYNGFHIQDTLIKKGKQPNDRLKLNYPIASLFGRTVTLQQNFFGIDLYGNGDNTTQLLKSFRDDEGTDEDAGAAKGTNGTDLLRTTRSEFTDPRITNMKMVKMIVFQLRAEHNEGWRDMDVKKYEMDIVRRLAMHESERLRFYTLSQTYVEEEMVRAGISLLPYLTVGFFIMCTCSVVSVLTRAIYLNQHSLPKVFLAVTACVLPFMSCATALGAMFTCGVRFASILCVIPFLVLAIGVDSSYLMIHEWQRVTKHCRDAPNRKNAKVGYRVSEVLSEVGPAILISTLTNIFADGVGAFTSSPEITLLCAGNLACMAVMYVYQMTFYAGLFSLVGRYEVKQEKQERQDFEASMRAPKNEPLSIRRNKLTRQSSKFHDTTKHYTSATIERYVSIVAKKTVAIAIVLAYFAYLAISIWGISRININLTLQKLFAGDSPLLELDKLREEYQVPHFTMASVFVNHPGNLSIPERMARMNQFVGDMEALKGSWGPVGTQYFVRDFITFEKSFEGDLGGEEEPSDGKVPATTSNPAFIYKEEDLPTFIEWPEYNYWSGFIRLDNVTDKLEKFFFTTAYHGTDLSIWTERGKLLNKWRSIVDKYSPEFDASVFHEDGVFLDLIENMPTDTWQSVLGTLICMGAVCFLFLNSFFTVIMASGCVLSICTGILGILSWWGVDLDPITMAAMIISIGCSVDIPAHVSYHYYQAGAGMPDSTSEDKLANCLSSVAFPALQAALSTILCVCSLLFVKLYMSYVFVKTMFLCVVLCNLHGLVFLPAFLILFDSVVGHVKRTAAHARRKKVRTERDHQLEEKRRQASPATRPKEEGKNGNVAHNTLEV